MGKTHKEIELIAFKLIMEVGGDSYYTVAGRDDAVDHYEVVVKEVETDMDAADWTGEITLHEEEEFATYDEAVARADELAKKYLCDWDEVTA